MSIFEIQKGGFIFNELKSWELWKLKHVQVILFLKGIYATAVLLWSNNEIP